MIIKMHDLSRSFISDTFFTNLACRFKKASKICSRQQFCVYFSEKKVNISDDSHELLRLTLFEKKNQKKKNNNKCRLLQLWSAL